MRTSRIRPEDIRQMTIPEIESNLADLRRELLDLRFNHTISPVENPARMRLLRRNIARLLTELNARKRQNA